MVNILGTHLAETMDILIGQDRLNCPKIYAYLSSYTMQDSAVTYDQTAQAQFPSVVASLRHPDYKLNPPRSFFPPLNLAAHVFTVL